MIVSDLFLPLFIIAMGLLIWSHANISRRAFHLALQHTQKHQVTLLDQSVVLKKMCVAKSKSSLLCVQRQYDFEFSSVGDSRYTGHIIFKGAKLSNISLGAFKEHPEL